MPNLRKLRIGVAGLHSGVPSAELDEAWLEPLDTLVRKQGAKIKVEFSVPTSYFEAFDKRGEELIDVPFRIGCEHDGNGKPWKKFWRTVERRTNLGYWITGRPDRNVSYTFIRGCWKIAGIVQELSRHR